MFGLLSLSQTVMLYPLLVHLNIPKTVWLIFVIAGKCRHKTLCSPYDRSSSWWYQAHFDVYHNFHDNFRTSLTNPWESSLVKALFLMGDGMSNHL